MDNQEYTGAPGAVPTPPTITPEQELLEASRPSAVDRLDYLELKSLSFEVENIRMKMQILTQQLVSAEMRHAVHTEMMKSKYSLGDKDQIQEDGTIVRK